MIRSKAGRGSGAAIGLADFTPLSPLGPHLVRIGSQGAKPGTRPSADALLQAGSRPSPGRQRNCGSEQNRRQRHCCAAPVTLAACPIFRHIGGMSEPLILVENLVKRYGSTLAVDGISFTVERGVTTALLGGNGAGKTTTLSILLGLLLPTSGAVRILGEDLLRHRYRVLPRMNFSSPYVDLP